MSAFEAFLTRGEDKDKTAVTELAAAAVDPETYRPSVIRAHPQLAFCLVEEDGTMHGFPYHGLRHPKHEVRNDEEFLSFTADGIAVVMQGSGLKVIFLALLRHTLAEAREYDGKPVTDSGTRITRLAVQDTQERLPQEPPRLVK